jgi:hypothetical protein
VAASTENGAASLSLSALLAIFGNNRELCHMALTRFDKAGFARIREPWEARDYKRVGQVRPPLPPLYPCPLTLALACITLTLREACG